jgi:drug/metabolite transporter (DMT)-like permease
MCANGNDNANGNILTMESHADKKAVAAAAITVLLWASAFVAIRSATQHFSPGALALGRLFTGSVVLGVIWLVRGGGWPPRAAWPGIGLSGVLWFGLYMISLNWGERDVDAGTAAMLVNLGPIVIALLGGWLLKEGFAARLMAGMVVAFVGVVVVSTSMSGVGRATIAGVFLCLVAAVTSAAGVVSQKFALRHTSAVQVTTFGCVIGMVACLPFAGQLASQVTRAPLSATLIIVYLGIFPTALAFTTWTYALSRTTASRMGITIYVVPAVVVLMSWVTLRQVPGWLTLLGGLVCLAGVGISRGRSKSVSKIATLPPQAPLPTAPSGTSAS